MFFLYLTCSVYAIYLTGVSADCGHCEVDGVMSTEEQKQAKAFNKMPKSWVPYPIDINAPGFLETGPNTYGPKTCSGPCVPDWNHHGRGDCTYTSTEHTVSNDDRGNTEYKRIEHTKTHGPCVTKYQDNTARTCIRPPVYSSYYKVWCYVRLGNGMHNWGPTHYPVCSTKQEMCAPPFIACPLCNTYKR